MSTKMYAYKNSSKTARALSEALGIKRLKHEGDRVDSQVINWGASLIKREILHPVINPPFAVGIAVNKLRAFKCLQGYVPIPAWTESKEEASRWLLEGVYPAVVCRTKLTANSGKGIVFAEIVADLVDAPLYTAYVPKKEEYRVHVFRGNAFFIQRKARKLDVPKEKVNWKIRNHGNGFIFAHKDVECPEGVKEAAIKAVQALGLDFGGVDVGWHPEYGVCVYEVNTAPGLEGTSLDKYVEIFKEIIQ